MDISLKLQVTGISELVTEIRKWLNANRKKQYKIVIAGTSGTGKSTLINQLAGEEIAPVGDYQDQPVTDTVNSYLLTDEESQLHIVDTPGLGSSEQVDQYLSLERSKVEEPDLFLFVSKLPDSRVSGDEKRAINLISETLGSEIWEKSMLVFTFSDFLEPSQSKVALQKRTELLQKVIADHAGSDVASHVSSIAVPNSDETVVYLFSGHGVEIASPGAMNVAGQAVDKDQLIALLRAASTVMSGSTSQDRVEAIATLAEIGDESAVPVLCEALEHDQNAEVRRRAAEALGKIGSSGKADTKE